MRRFVLLLALAVVSVGRVVADEVSEATALRIASEALGYDATRSGSLAIVWDSNALCATRSGNNAPSFYVVASTTGRGFVIVAGDDAITPILAYSEEYPAPDMRSMHPSLNGWFRYVDRSVRYARLNNLSPDASIAALWARPSVADGSITLGTARWSQYMPYNKYCPLDGDVLSLTGCTQTAMAEIMHYYKWPERAKGTTEPFTTMTKGIEVGSRDLNHRYDWANMLDEYIQDQYSDKEGDAVAVLMADLGHSFKADYGAESTGALPDALAMYENYGYSPACHYAMRDNFSEKGWNRLMRREIEARRPIFYSAYTADENGEAESGHAFVLDGVDDNDYFHVNWGWGGPGDGFFKLDSLVLYDFIFDTLHWAFLGIHPLRNGEVDNWLYIGAPGISTQATEFVAGESFVVDGITIINPSILDFSGEVRLGVCNITGEFKSWASEPEEFALPSMYGSSVVDVTATINEEILSGDRLRAFYRSDDGDEWHQMMLYQDGACFEVVLKHPTIGESTSLEFDKVEEVMILKFDDNVKASLYFLAELVEGGVEQSEGRMTIKTDMLQRGVPYTIYLEREGGESKSLMFTLNEM